MLVYASICQYIYIYIYICIYIILFIYHMLYICNYILHHIMFYILIQIYLYIYIYTQFARQSARHFLFLALKLVENWIVKTGFGRVVKTCEKLDLEGRKMNQRPKWTLVHKARNIKFSIGFLAVFQSFFKCMGDLGSAVLCCCL